MTLHMIKTFANFHQFTPEKGNLTGKYIKNSSVHGDWRSTVDSSQLTFVPISKSRDTKTRPDIKNPARSKLDIVPYFKNPWSVASSHCKWRRR